MPRFIYLNDTPISLYFLFGLSGFLFATIIALIKRKAFDLRKRDILRIAGFVIVGAVLGARLFGAVGRIFLYGSEPDFWTSENWQRIISGGGVFFGGLFGAVGLVVLRAKIGRMNIRDVFNILAYAALAFQSLGRIAC